MLNVFCTKVGTKYGPEYVNRLAAMVRKNLTIPHRFICTTDDTTGIDSEIECRAPARSCWGWWNLQEAYSNPPWAEGGPILYMGLDTIIIQNIDSVISERVTKDRLTLLRDFWYLSPDKTRTMFSDTYADGIAFVPTGGVPFLWVRFMTEIGDDDQTPMHVYNTHQLKRVGMLPDFWQDVAPNFVCSFKWPELKQVVPPEPVVCFHGDPRPAEAAIDYPWIREYWGEWT